MWPVRVTKQHSDTVRSSLPWWAAVDRTFKIDKSVPLGPFSSEYAKQNANQLSGKLARLAFTGAICEMKKLGKTA